jgi:hypothetical protein
LFGQLQLEEHAPSTGPISIGKSSIQGLVIFMGRPE